ncbi:MAG: hypothetical protein IRZ21_12585 [Thermoleophilaceae bacterium]|nr:hypothetical protein [Thermoleophilaceae bacterium]
MKRFIESQKPLIERHGLLPGITVAFFIVLAAMLALVSATWVAVFVVLAVLVTVTAVVVWIVVQVAGDDEQPRAS